MAVGATSSGRFEIYRDRAKIYCYNPEQDLALKMQCPVPVPWPAGLQHGAVCHQQEHGALKQPRAKKQHSLLLLPASAAHPVQLLSLPRTCPGFHVSFGMC